MPKKKPIISPIHGNEHLGIGDDGNLYFRDYVDKTKCDETHDAFTGKPFTEAQMLYKEFYYLTNLYVSKNPNQDNGKPMSYNQAMKFVYKQNPELFSHWSESSLRKIYSRGLDLSINH